MAPLEKARKDLQRFIDRPRIGWLLSRSVPDHPLVPAESRLGGSPHAGEMKSWPTCPACRVPLNFILQLNRRRLPQMWFPPGKNLFQLFRCPNSGCRRNGKKFDRFMVSQFVTTRRGRQSVLHQPEVDLEGHFDWPELPMPESQLNIQRVRDYPSGYEGREGWWGKSWRSFQDRYTSDDLDRWDEDQWFYDADFWKLIPNCEGIKIDGLPSWQQGGYAPKCKCGRKTEFFFQLASVIGDLGDKRVVCIGDAGNIYYFVCRRCGERSVTTLWDCG